MRKIAVFVSLMVAACNGSTGMTVMPDEPKSDLPPPSVTEPMPPTVSPVPVPTVDPRCRITNSFDIAILDAGLMGVQVAVSDVGALVAGYSSKRKQVEFVRLDRDGFIVGGMSAIPTPEWYFRVIAGKDDYFVIVQHPTGDPVMEQLFYHVKGVETRLVRRAKGITSFEVVSDGKGEFYSLEFTDAPSGTSVGSTNGGPLTDQPQSIFRIHQLISGRSTPDRVLHYERATRLSDAQMVGDRLSVLMTHGTDAFTAVLLYRMELTGADRSDVQLNVSGQPGRYGLWPVVHSATSRVTGNRVLALPSRTAAFWVDDVINQAGGYNRSFHMSMMTERSEQVGPHSIEPIMVRNRSFVVGWGDRIAALKEAYDADTRSVSLRVIGNDGATSETIPFYTDMERGRYVQSFDGRDGRFVIAEGFDLVSGRDGGRAQFINCK